MDATAEGAGRSAALLPVSRGQHEGRSRVQRDSALRLGGQAGLRPGRNPPRRPRGERQERCGYCCASARGCDHTRAGGNCNCNRWPDDPIPVIRRVRGSGANLESPSTVNLGAAVNPRVTVNLGFTAAY